MLNLAAAEFQAYVVSTLRAFKGEMRINFILLNYSLNLLECMFQAVV